MVAHMDGLVGRLLTTLEVHDLATRTIVVFVGDNGTSRRIRSIRDGEKVRGGKGTTTDGGTHVPLLIRAPGLVKPGTVFEDLVCTRDLLPTLVRAAGAEPPADSDGLDLLPLLRGEAALDRDALAFWYWPRPRTRPESRPIRFALDRRYRLYDDGRMFDRVADPDEQAPLDSAEDAELREARTRLAVAIESLPRAKGSGR
jgi:arylsulfatase A-like enzyme